MEVRDYEYYKAREKDIKLEDITSSQNNEVILASLRDDDPVEDMYIGTNNNYEFVVREGDHLGWLGYFVGKSTQLEALYIYNCPENINLNAFFEGLGRNRSIETLGINIDLGESFKSLLPFLRNNDSLYTLGFNGIDIGPQCAPNISFLLSQQSFLRSLDFDETNLDDAGLKQIAVTLRSQPQLEQISLKYNSDLAVANPDNGDEGLIALAAELKHSHSLRSLEVFGSHMFTEEGSRSLSTLFLSDNCRLEYLELGQMSIGDDEAAVLATGLASLSSLKRLEFWGMSISDRGLQDLVRGLANCNLEKLTLSSNMLMDSVSGLRALGALVRKMTNMHTLHLCDSLTDEGLQSFVEGMAYCCSLTKLYLTWNRSITANGLTYLSSLFRAEHCSLSDLSLHHIYLGDDEAAALANGLIGNKSLTSLRFDAQSITVRGWSAFRRLLCDSSSMNDTYLSNHTLVEIGEYRMENTPMDVVKYLKLNETDNQAAAICKILHSHPDIDVTPLFRFNLMCLPLVVAWFEKAKSCLCNMNESTESFQSRELSAVYKFVRGMPLLAANGFRSEMMKDIQVQSKKRKLDQTV